MRCSVSEVSCRRCFEQCAHVTMHWAETALWLAAVLLIIALLFVVWVELYWFTTRLK